MWMACSCEGHRLDRKRRSPSCHLLPMWQGVGGMTLIPSAKQRVSRWCALLEMSLMVRNSPSKSKQRYSKKREGSSIDLFVWTPASSLLVILHYLLKNNITFMWVIRVGLFAPNDSCMLLCMRKSAFLGRGGKRRIGE